MARRYAESVTPGAAMMPTWAWRHVNAAPWPPGSARRFTHAPQLAQIATWQAPGHNQPGYLTEAAPSLSMQGPNPACQAPAILAAAPPQRATTVHDHG